MIYVLSKIAQLILVLSLNLPNLRDLKSCLMAALIIDCRIDLVGDYQRITVEEKTEITSLTFAAALRKGEM